MRRDGLWRVTVLGLLACKLLGSNSAGQRAGAGATGAVARRSEAASHRRSTRSDEGLQGLPRAQTRSGSWPRPPPLHSPRTCPCRSPVRVPVRSSCWPGAGPAHSYAPCYLSVPRSRERLAALTEGSGRTGPIGHLPPVRVTCRLSPVRQARPWMWSGPVSVTAEST
jgi:hypothetical protein